MMHFFAPWTDPNERDKIWVQKRDKLQSVDYHVAELDKNITVQKGWWFSAHENWKYLFLPYNQVEITRNLLKNGEKVRTWDAKTNNLPGMFASINGNLTKNTDQI